MHLELSLTHFACLSIASLEFYEQYFQSLLPLSLPIKFTFIVTLCLRFPNYYYIVKNAICFYENTNLFILPQVGQNVPLQLLAPGTRHISKSKSAKSRTQCINFDFVPDRLWSHCRDELSVYSWNFLPSIQPWNLPTAHTTVKALSLIHI